MIIFNNTCHFGFVNGNVKSSPCSHLITVLGRPDIVVVNRSQFKKENTR